MKRLPLLLLLVFCGAKFALAQDLSPGDSRPPNVVLIFADDLGYGDPGCYGGEMVPTPNIDRLADEGIRFTDGYASATVCAPSRAGLLTGAYQQRFGMQGNFDRRMYRIPESHAILPEAFRNAGYRAAAVGKWNIIVPPERALDELYSRIDWEADFWPIGEGPRAGEYIGVDEERWDWTRARHVDSSKTQYWGPRREGDEYLTDRLGRQASEFIRANEEKPFFLYLAFNAVHTPLQAKKAYEERVSHLEPEALRMYAAMLISMDEAIGEVLTILDETGSADNTIVAFLSDNGPAMAPIVGWRKDWSRDPLLLGSTGGLRGHKGNHYEGGIRVPFILRWPARWDGGRVSNLPVTSLDLYPTFAEAAGVPVSETTELDGLSLLSYLGRGAESPQRDAMYWYQDSVGWAIRKGDWKLLMRNGGDGPELFNLATDPEESKNLAADEPVKVSELRATWQAWAGELPPPANPEAPGRGPASGERDPVN